MAKKTKSEKTKKSAKELQEEVLDSAHEVWLAGLGALSRAQEEGGKFFRALVERGQELEGKGREKAGEVKEKVGEKVQEARKEARVRGENLGKMVDERVSGMLQRMGVPNRDEIQQLTERVEALNRKIEAMGATEEAAAKKTAAKKKPAAKKTTKKSAAAKKTTTKKATAKKKTTAKKPAAKKSSSKKTTGGAK